MKKSILIFFCIIVFSQFGRTQSADFIKGADISWLQEIEAGGGVFKEKGILKDLFSILKDHGFNYIRLRIWHTPENGINGIDSTLRVALRAKQAGLNVLIDFHFSDWWADPAHQTKPAAWNGLLFDVLKDSVRGYVHDVITALKNQGTLPQTVQFGNEIIGGMLWPDGDIRGSLNTDEQWIKFTDLLKSAQQGMNEVLSDSDTVLSMIHIDRGGDYNSCAWFFDKLFAHNVACDVIGLSYYPWWHGSFATMTSNITKLETRYNKDIVLAEIAYPFTLQYNDDKNNIVGTSGQLLPDYPATVEGQTKFLSDVITIVKNVPNGHGRGVFYWEPDGISAPQWKSPWENLSLFDFNGEVLSSIKAFEDVPVSVREVEAKRENTFSFTVVPNPFNPTTVINYQLPITNHVTLKVYDVIGREVAVLVNDVKEAGTYSATFEASKLSSGMYFAQLQSNGKQIMKKMLLLK